MSPVEIDFNKINFSEFFNLQYEEFGNWWCDNVALWLADPWDKNLFKPISSINTGRGDNLLQKLYFESERFPVYTQRKFKRGLHIALNKAFTEQKNTNASVFIQAATTIKYSGIQRVVFKFLEVKQISYWFAPCFDGLTMNSSVFDSILQHTEKVIDLDMTPELLKKLDTLLSKPGYEHELTFERAQDIFLQRVRLDSEQIKSITESFVLRIKTLLEKQQLEIEYLLFNIEILFRRLDEEQLDSVFNAFQEIQTIQNAQEEMTDQSADELYPYTLPNVSADIVNCEWAFAPWLYWAFFIVLYMFYGVEHERLLVAANAEKTDEDEHFSSSSVTPLSCAA